MNKIVLFLLLLVTLSTTAQELTWHTDVSKASTIATKEKKPMLLFFTGSDWCGWCIRLQNEVFKKPEFVEWAEKNVILVELDYPRKFQLEENLKAQNAQMQQMFQVSGYPTIWFVKPNQNQNGFNLVQIGKTGYIKGGAENWLQTANEILKSN